MYALFSKSEQWHEGYKSLMSEKGDSLCCTPCQIDFWKDALNELIKDDNFIVFKKDENNYIVREVGLTPSQIDFPIVSDLFDVDFSWLDNSVHAEIGNP